VAVLQGGKQSAPAPVGIPQSNKFVIKGILQVIGDAASHQQPHSCWRAHFLPLQLGGPMFL